MFSENLVAFYCLESGSNLLHWRSNTKFKTLRSFFEYLENKEYIKLDASNDIIEVKNTKFREDEENRDPNPSSEMKKRNVGSKTENITPSKKEPQVFEMSSGSEEEPNEKKRKISCNITPPLATSITPEKKVGSSKVANANTAVVSDISKSPALPPKKQKIKEKPVCPICNTSLINYNPQQLNSHVDECLTVTMLSAETQATIKPGMHFIYRLANSFFQSLFHLSLYQIFNQYQLTPLLCMAINPVVLVSLRNDTCLQLRNFLKSKNWIEICLVTKITSA